MKSDHVSCVARGRRRRRALSKHGRSKHKTEACPCHPSQTQTTSLTLVAPTTKNGRVSAVTDQSKDVNGLAPINQSAINALN